MESVKAPAPKVFYFGYDGGGHRMIDSTGEQYFGGDGSRPTDIRTPWGATPDATLCPYEGFVLSSEEAANQKEGLAALHHKDGWTAIAFWDRSGDKRWNSNSNFLVRGTYSFGEMLALARHQFPGVFARMRFEVTDANAEKVDQEEAQG